MRSHVCKALWRYWPARQADLVTLPIEASQGVTISGPLKLRSIRLPNWAAEYGIDGALLVPTDACSRDDDWQRVDWWLGTFLLLECWHERTWELHHGPIHSYSFRLKGWDTRAWEHAWVNRIALFMRVWAAREQAKAANELFGPSPSAEVLMTHDVDAICKTIPGRLKQGAFNLFNAGRHLAQAEVTKAFDKVSGAARLLFGREDGWIFDVLLEQEKQAGIRAHFNFYADTRTKTPHRWLFDPGYDILDERVRNLMQKIQEQGGVIGLHPSFDAWNSVNLIRRQRDHLSNVANQPITNCRQHWLRFSWQDTWRAQEDAGIAHDATLMFNDRPGYRASAALAWQPWNQNRGRAHFLTEQPTVIMDSHFYDYQALDAGERKAAMRRWIDETCVVHGQIAVLWHPHTLTKDYGWMQGFQDLLTTLSEKTPCAHLH
jgi:hypothetical protein